MNKWWCLLSAIVLWVGAGVAITGLRQDRVLVEAPAPEQTGRIVCMAPNLTEIAFALGLGDRVVGVSLESDYPPEANERAKVGTFWQPDIESVIAARPDLVITLGFEQQRTIADRLQRMGYNCLTLKIEKVPELYGAIEEIGAATGTGQQAEALVANIRARLERLSEIANKGEKVRVLWVVQREPLRVAGRETFIDEMIEMAGGRNAIGPTFHQYPPIGAEQVIACSPEVIIEPAMAQTELGPQRDTALEYWNRFENLPAVAGKRVYVIHGDLVSRLGPRLYEAVEAIARCIEPELRIN
ncbi:MAG: ABC transporter substrate-binding protein [Phycisphaerales bacterium]|nr:MAG: ABC transporter substrate-binding protein [Phycisphaerales bacterium]